MKEIIGVVLAGGAGKRFWPIEKDKSLLKFLGKPLILYTLEALSNSGVEPIVVVANPRNHKEIREIKIKGVNIKVVIQKKPLGMGDALLCAQKLIKNHPILVVNAADVFDEKVFKDVILKARKKNTEIVIPGLIREEYFPGGYLKVKKGKVIQIVEKPKEGSEPSNLVNLVSHFFRKPDDLFNRLKRVKTRKDDAYEQAISKLLKDRGATLIRYKGFYGFLKLPWHVLDMMDLFLNKKLTNFISNKASVHPSASLEGPVFLDKDVLIGEHAIIKGPCFIGAGTYVGTNALIIKSMIGKDCVIGFSSEITRSYLGDACWHHTNYIGDSVLEAENYFGAGAVTANFRFDERSIHSLVREERLDTKRIKFGAVVGHKARVGVNASLMPGIKIGAEACIGPGVVQYVDVGSNQLVLVDSKRVIKVKSKK